MQNLMCSRHFPVPVFTALPGVAPFPCHAVFIQPPAHFHTPQTLWHLEPPMFRQAHFSESECESECDSAAMHKFRHVDEAAFCRKRRRSITSGESADTRADGEVPVSVTGGAACSEGRVDCTPQQGADTPSSPSSAAAGAHEGGIDDHTDAYQNQDRLCAEVLQLLSRADSWDSVTSQVDRNAACRAEEAPRLSPTKKCRKTSSRTCAVGAPRRKYTWRSLHHRNNKVACEAIEEPVRTIEVEPEVPACASAGSHKEQDKEWAALTTWLRMNLHQPRTNKRQVLFTADLPKPGEPWLFILNPELVWDDISMDTKLRLKNLPDEAEAAYAHKYPNRPSDEWEGKTQKYRPMGATETIQVPLGDMVHSLCNIYYVQEGLKHT